VADHGLLDLQGAVFGHRQVRRDQRGDRRAACLAEQQRGLRVDVDEDDFDRRLLRLVGGDDLGQAVEDGLDPLRQAARRIGLDAAAGDIGQLVAGSCR
jgi:hypothetical protein